MLNVLFWNVNKKDLRVLVCQAAAAVAADVVILLENGPTIDDTLASLRSSVASDFARPTANPSRFHLFSRDAGLDLSEAYGGDRISLRRLSYAGTELLLGLVHVVDRRNWDVGNRAGQVQLLADEIRRHEDGVGHNRTVLLGDFNMNPFEDAMNMALGLNAMMTKTCVRRETRTLQKRDYRFFYNPMWGLFGDRSPGASGTFYHSGASQGNYGWNMLDQVLVRPAAIKWFANVQILTSAGETSLATASQRPNKKKASDHFPILLTLK